MTFTTDERLKGFLDTNQLSRERICVAVLGMDKRFSDIKPQHPRGGPDQGKDIVATFEGDRAAVCGVGFLNQAADTQPQKTKIKKKFKEDLAKAENLSTKPTVFVFFSNVNLNVSEKTDLVDLAIKSGMTYCEIFDRERIRIALDTPDGFAARFQYLGIPLSEAEQASFFARWGQDIESLISTGFGEVKKTLNHMLFIQESARVLQSIYVLYEFDKEYNSDEIGHFRAFLLLRLKEAKENIFSILFGSYDKPGRATIGENEDPQDFLPGAKHGIGHSQWEQTFDIDDVEDATETTYNQSGGGSAIGENKLKQIVIKYNHDDWLFRFQPRLKLSDLDEAMIMPVISEDLKCKIASIRIFANGYKLFEETAASLWFDETEWKFECPIIFDEEELKQKWIRVRPKHMASNYWLHFNERVPMRIFTADSVR